MKRFPHRFVFVSLILCTNYLLGQNLPIDKIKLFEEKEEVVVKSFLVDNKNFIWFVSNNNLYRFDGSSSKEMGSSIKNWNAKNITKLFLCSHNKIWVTGTNNVGYIDVNTWTYTPIQVNPEDIQAAVAFIYESDSGSIIFGYHNGSILFVKKGSFYWNKTIKEKSIESKVQISIRSAINFNDRLWMSTSNGNLLEFSEDEKQIVNTHQITDNISIESILPFDSYMMFELKDRGLFKWTDDKLKKLEEIPFSQEVHYVKDTPRHLFYLDNRSLYMFGKYKNAKVHHEPLNIDLKNINDVQINQSNILVANNSGIYNISVRSNGVFQYNPIPQNDINSARDIHFFEDGSHFFCTYNGAGFVDVKGNRTIFDKRLAQYKILPISKDTLLISSEGSFLDLFDRKTVSFSKFNYHTKLSAKKMRDNSYVTSLAQDDEYYYTGSYSGMLKVNKKTHEVSELEIKNKDISYNINVREISVNGDKIFLSTRNGFYEIYDREIHKIYPAEGNETVHAHEILRDTIWLATQSSGLIGINAKGEYVAKYTIAEGMTDNLVYSLASLKGNLFAFTGYGFNLYKNGKVTPYLPRNKEDNGEYNHASIGYDYNKKTIYAGGLKGYTKIDLNFSFEQVTSPKFVVTDMVVSNKNNELITQHNLSYLENQKIHIPKESNYFRINFKNEELDTNKPRLEYKISDLFANWTRIDVSKNIELVGITPGSHNLFVRYPGSRNIQEFIIEKEAFYYQKWWFYLSVFLVVLGTAFYYFKFRLKLVKTNERLRSRIAADLHDDIGSILGGIMAQSQFASIEPEKTPQILKRIKDNSRIGLQALSDIVWSVDQKNDHWDSFIEKLKIHGTEATNMTTLKFTFRVLGNLPKKKLAQQVRQNLWLIYKETLMNCIKHSQANHFSATINFISRKKIQMILKDNGIGFNEEQINPGNGLKNIRMRTDAMGGRCEIDSKEKGTKLIITVSV